MLFLYAITFSYAYISLDTGTGALILFGVVQITIILVSRFTGTYLHVMEWLGVIIAFMGFVYLIFPDISTPSIKGFLMMTIAGMSWGFYTLFGRSSKQPLVDTGYNFIKTLPMVVILALITMKNATPTAEGIVLAALSGGITSGIGYAIWYVALGGLTSTQAAVLQLTVPIIAAFGGVIFVSEPVSRRLVMASFLILGGILLVVLGKDRISRLEQKS